MDDFTRKRQVSTPNQKWCLQSPSKSKTFIEKGQLICSEAHRKQCHSIRLTTLKFNWYLKPHLPTEIKEFHKVMKKMTWQGLKQLHQNVQRGAVIFVKLNPYPRIQMEWRNEIETQEIQIKVHSPLEYAKQHSDCLSNSGTPEMKETASSSNTKRGRGGGG